MYVVREYWIDSTSSQGHHRHLRICSAVACIQHNKSLPSICSQKLTGCLKSASVEHYLPPWRCLSGLTGETSPASIPWTGLVTDHSTLDYSFYSSDLTPSDFHLFGRLKKIMADMLFSANSNTKQAVTSLQ